jgi:hypothetical protein
MLLLGLLTVALADDCPDPAVTLGRAESDALSFFLADAEAGLAATLEAWSCGPAASPEHLGRFLRIKGLLAMYADDPEAASRAFAASKGIGGTFHDDYGADARALWDSAESPEGEPATLQLKGLRDGEQLWVDGLPSEPTAAPGLHLLQVAPGDGELARFARLFDAQPAAELLVAVSGEVPVPAPVPEPEPEPEDPEEPEPDHGIAWGPRVIPKRAQPIAPPLAPHPEHRNRYLDADGDEYRWRSDVLPLGRYDIDGAIARRRYRRTRAGQIVAFTSTGLFAYLAYLNAWDVTTGHNRPTSSSAGATLLCAGLSVGSGLWGRHLLKKRPEHRADVEASAQRVITGNAL